MSKFFGIILSENESYEQYVSSTFRVSSVSLDGTETVKLYLTVEKEKHLVATLSKKTRQMTMDLLFNKGDSFKFEIEGRGKISILGYQLPEPKPESPYDEVKSEASGGYEQNKCSMGESPPLYSPGNIYPRSESPADQNDGMLEHHDYDCPTNLDSGEEEDDNASNSEEDEINDQLEEEIDNNFSHDEELL